MTTTCERYEKTMEDLLAGEIEDDSLKDLLAHLEECEPCRRLWDLHDDLSDLAPPMPEPSEHELRRMRRAVLQRLDAERRAPGSVRWLQVAIGGVAAVLFAAAGFWVGQGSVPVRLVAPVADSGSVPEGYELAALINESAAHNEDLAAIEESPFMYSDIRVRDVGDGQVDLAFNVTTHMELTRAADDPLVTEVLVQGLLQPGSLGARLRAISMAPALDPKVRDALVRTMLEDKSVAVRIKALERLARNAPDERVEAAFLEVLVRDESARMRLDSIDYLAEHGIEAAVIEEALREGPNEPSGAILARARARQSS